MSKYWIPGFPRSAGIRRFLRWIELLIDGWLTGGPGSGRPSALTMAVMLAGRLPALGIISSVYAGSRAATGHSGTTPLQRRFDTLQPFDTNTSNRRFAKDSLSFAQSL